MLESFSYARPGSTGLLTTTLLGEELSGNDRVPVGKPVFITVMVAFTDITVTTVEDIEWFLYDNGSTACPTDCTTTLPAGSALAPTGGIVTKSVAVAAQNQNATFMWIDTVPIAGTNIYCLGLENATNATGDPTVGNVTFSAWQ